METILCLFLMMQSFSAAKSTPSRSMTELEWTHSSTNASYQHVNTPAPTILSNQTNNGSEAQLQTKETPLIWIVMAAILSSTIVITISVSLGIKFYFKRQSCTQQPETYFNGLVMTNAVFIPIPNHCVPTDYKGERFPVFWEDCTTSVNK